MNNKYLLKIIKYIDYIYLNSYINNLLIIKKYDEDLNKWKIFSTCFNNNKKNYEQFNILHLIKSIISQNEFNYEILLISIHIYEKICIKYAHLIDNYTYLFGSVYISMNKILSDNFLSDNFLSNLFDIHVEKIILMIKCIDYFIDFNDIYFDINDKKKIINEIYYT